SRDHGSAAPSSEVPPSRPCVRPKETPQPNRPADPVAAGGQRSATQKRNTSPLAAADQSAGGGRGAASGRVVLLALADRVLSQAVQKCRPATGELAAGNRRGTGATSGGRRDVGACGLAPGTRRRRR